MLDLIILKSEFKKVVYSSVERIFHWVVIFSARDLISQICQVRTSNVESTLSEYRLTLQ